MQPNPKKVRRNEEKDYAEIYQENFIAQNDPAPLGQAAYNRQLSAGVRKRIGEDRLAKEQFSTAKPGLKPPTPVIPFETSQFDAAMGEGFTNPVERGPGRFGIDSELAKQPFSTFKPSIQTPAAPIQTSEFDAEMGADFRNPVQRGPGRFGVDAELGSLEGAYIGNISNTQRAGYSQAGDIQRNRTAGLQAQRDARTQEIMKEVGAVPRYVDPSDYNTQRKFGLDAYNEAVRNAQIEADLINARNAAYQNPTDRSEFENTVDRGVQPEYVDPSDYNLSRKAGVDAYNEAVRNAQIQADLANARNRELQERYGAEQTQQEARQRAEQRAAQGEVGLTGSTIPTLEEMTGIMPSELGTPSERVDYTGAGLQAPKTREELEAELDAAVEAGTAFGGGTDTTPEPFEEVVGETDDAGNAITLSGATASYDNGITREEQRLNQQLDAEENAVLQEFNQKYNQFIQLAINRGAVRGDLESQGFTGGIGQQVQDFLSTQEMQMFNQLISEKDQALEAIRLERNNIPNAAKANYLQNLELENASLQAQTAFSQMISQKVLDGSMSLQEANSLAQEYGLQDVQSVFQSAIEAQIAAGTMNEGMAKAELERLGLDTSFLDEIGGGVEFTDFATSDEARELEETINSLIPSGSWETIAGGAVAGAGTGALMGLAGGIFAPVTVPAGVIIGGIVGGLAGANVDLNKNDIGKITTGLFNSKIMLEQGQTILNGNYESMTIERPAGQSNTFGQLANKFQVTIDGQTYEMEGADIMVLAAALKKKNYSQTDPRYKAIFDTAKEAKESAGVVNFGRVADAVAGQKYSTVIKFYNQAF